ncbi:MAG: PAS/PAC sensor hybrid histidine kinase [bacterium]|nr:MAG: PAS/PAC sensor hybrid histidine kinase [bacterium]
MISVSDNGSGIASEILDRIFDPFFTTKAIGKGTGLGLSTVISIVKDHGGFIRVDSQLGRGTEFEVFLPAINVEETQEIGESNDTFLLGKGELILVVDDEASICEITKTSLETYNYKVLTARDGIEAITLYVEHKEKIALVLTDMMMPLLDCPKIIQAFQKINPDVKIIVISGAPSTSKIQELRHLGIKMFLPKPYTLDTLLETLQKILN